MVDNTKVDQRVVDSSKVGTAIVRKSVSQISQTAMGMGLFTALAFVSGILIARGLGPVGQGKFQLLMSIAFIAVLVGKMGLDEGLAYLIPHYNVTNTAKLSSLISYSIGLACVISIVLGLMFYLGSGYLGRYIFTLPGFSDDLTVLLYLVPALMLLYMTIAVLRGLGRSDLRAYVYYYGVSLLFLSTLTIFFVRGLNPNKAYLARTGSYAVGGAMALALIWRMVPRGRWNLRLSDIRSLHSFAGILVFVGFFQYAVEQPLIDLMIVGHVDSPETVGIYSVVARVASLVAITANSFCIVLAPTLADASARNNSNEMRSQYVRASEWMARLSLFSGLGLFLLREEVLTLFGLEYQTGANLLTILLAGQVGAGLLGLNTPLLLASGYAWVELLITSLCAVGMTLGGIVLGQIYGTPGVAVTTATVTIILAFGRRMACVVFCGITGRKQSLQMVLIGIVSLMPALLVQRLLPGTSSLNTIIAVVVFSCAYWGFNFASVTKLFSNILLRTNINRIKRGNAV